MNQKNHFVSTYQKDYVWPDMPGICQTEPSKKPPIAVKICACTDSPRVLKELLDTSLGEYLDRDRTRQLSETKICKTRLAKKLDRPSSICVKKLKREYSDELEKVSPDVDRFKTTYQAHYSDPAAARMTQRDLARATIHTNGQQLQCRMPIKITIETDYSPTDHPSPSRLMNDHKRKNGSKRENRCEIESKKLPPWKSEYQESISKIGHAIMRVKLHHAKRKTPLQYQQCISN